MSFATEGIKPQLNYNNADTILGPLQHTGPFSDSLRKKQAGRHEIPS
jgi:hypothetical protein